MGRGGPTRSGGGAAGRGLVLIVIAVALGLLLLRSTIDDADPVDVAAGTDSDASESDGEDTSTSVDDTIAAPDSGGEDQLDSTDTTLVDPNTSDTVPVETLPDVATIPPSEITVVVVNGGTGVQGAASGLTEQISPLGYITATPTNSTDNTVYEQSRIFHQDGYLAEANRLAGELGWDPTAVQPLPPATPPADDMGGANLVVVLGLDRVG